MLVKERLPQARLRIAGVELREDRALVRELKGRLEPYGGDVEWLPNVARDSKLEFLSELSVLSARSAKAAAVAEEHSAIVDDVLEMSLASFARLAK